MVRIRAAAQLTKIAYRVKLQFSMICTKSQGASEACTCSLNYSHRFRIVINNLRNLFQKHDLKLAWLQLTIRILGYNWWPRKSLLPEINTSKTFLLPAQEGEKWRWESLIQVCSGCSCSLMLHWNMAIMICKCSEHNSQDGTQWFWETRDVPCRIFIFHR